MIISPMATGNGAYIVHKCLESLLGNYRVLPYSPYLTLLPPSLLAVGRNTKAALIHTTPDYGCFFSRSGPPLVLTFHNYVLDTEMQAYSSRMQNIHYQTDLKWFTRQSLRQATAITAVSRFTAQLAKSDLKLDRDIEVIYNGIDQNTFYPRTKSNPSSKEIKVLFSGNLCTRKGVQWLPSIVDKLSANINIYYTTGLRKHRELPSHPRLKALGNIAFQDMPALYNSMDILLFPTVREGFGLAAAEAMACGLPVVATDCSSLPELVDHQQGGVLCELGNITAFANAINCLAENKDLRARMGAYNRDKIEREFTLSRMVKNYAELFETVLNQ